MLARSFNPMVKDTTFFGSLTHRLVTVVLVPKLVHHDHSATLNLYNTASVSFALPILRHANKLSVIPTTVIRNFVLDLLIPVLVTFFSTWCLSNNESLPPGLHWVGLPWDYVGGPFCPHIGHLGLGRMCWVWLWGI